MSTLWIILAMAMAVYVLRLAGFLLVEMAVPPTWERALEFVPIATLTAFIVAIVARPEEGPLRLIAAVGAGLAVRHAGRAWVGIVVGLTVYGLLRLCWANSTV
jgi:branched-subunit amino acid transport protein